MKYLSICLLFTLSFPLSAQTLPSPADWTEIPQYVVIGGNPDLQSLNRPAGYSLVVMGGILTERLRVATRNSTNWADYVLAPDYRLTPLSEVGRYIRANGHLPGIPSAQDVVKDGIDVVQMQAAMLAKIEELTLHAIRQEAELTRLRRQVRSLQRAHR